MVNARDEFTGFTEDLPDIRCAEVKVSRHCEDPKVVATLCENYGPWEVKKFLDALDFMYDDGYGSQKLFGTIWFLDGSWADRHEYDGAEWWVHRKLPKIPVYLNTPL